MSDAAKAVAMNPALREATRFDYDDEADVLYISIGTPRPAVSSEWEGHEGILLRHDTDTGELCGATIVFYSLQDRDVLKRAVPWFTDWPKAVCP